MPPCRARKDATGLRAARLAGDAHATARTRMPVGRDAPTLTAGTRPSSSSA